MAFQRPTLDQIVTRVQQDYVSRLGLAGAVLRRSMVFVASRVIAGAAHMLHGHVQYVSKQLFADKSDSDYLIRQASVFGMSPEAATFATGTASVTGVDGSVIPAGTLLQRADGTEYTVNADVTLASGGTVSVTCATSGADGTLAVGVVLAFESPISGVDSNAVVLTESDGTDTEDTEDFRTRFLAKFQDPPHGGNTSDYVAWAREVAGVTRAWVYPQELGAGTVVVRFMRDNDVGSAIPDSGEVATVQAHLNTVRPVTATVTAAAPVAHPVNYTIHVVPDTSATRAAITAELTDLHQAGSQPNTTLLLSEIRTAIGIAAGVTDYTMSAPAADVTNTGGQIPTLGTITWV